jgi:hypothetical protein
MWQDMALTWPPTWPLGRRGTWWGGRTRGLGGQAQVLAFGAGGIDRVYSSHEGAGGCLMLSCIRSAVVCQEVCWADSDQIHQH